MGIVLGLIKSARFWGVLGALAGLGTLATWGYNQVYSAGYTAAELKYKDAQLAAIEDAVGEARERWRLSAEAAEQEVRVETEIVERVRTIERRVPQVVEVAVPVDCHDLGDAVRELFNDAIRAGHDHQGSDPAAAAESGG